MSDAEMFLVAYYGRQPEDRVTIFSLLCLAVRGLFKREGV